MQSPDEPIDKHAEETFTEPTGAPPLPGEKQALNRTRSDSYSFIAQLRLWMAGLVISTELALGALVFAAFLLFPAYKGLRSGSTIHRLEQANQELGQQLTSAASRRIQLERTLSERDIQLTQRRQLPRVDSGSGLYVSPLLFLESKKPGTPDLINIDFSQAEQAILVFSLPRSQLQAVEISIHQESRLAWTQTISIPQQKLFNENLLTLLLTRSDLGAGTYRMTVEGDANGQRVNLNQFDLTIAS